MAFDIINQPNQSPRTHGPLHILRDTAPMLASAISTSDWVRGDTLSKLMGAVYSGVSGTLVVQFSADGANVDHEETISITGGTKNGGFVVDMVLPFFRLVYTNGGANQVIFRCNLFGRAVS